MKHTKRGLYIHYSDETRAKIAITPVSMEMLILIATNISSFMMVTWSPMQPTETYKLLGLVTCTEMVQLHYCWTASCVEHVVISS